MKHELFWHLINHFKSLKEAFQLYLFPCSWTIFYIFMIFLPASLALEAHWWPFVHMLGIKWRTLLVSVLLIVPWFFAVWNQKPKTSSRNALHVETNQLSETNNITRAVFISTSVPIGNRSQDRCKHHTKQFNSGLYMKVQSGLFTSQRTHKEFRAEHHLDAGLWLLHNWHHFSARGLSLSCGTTGPESICCTNRAEL